MNAIVEKAKKIMEDNYNDYLPDVEIGEICEINDIWDGNGDCPNQSYSYQIDDTSWINYVFEIIEVKENKLDTVIKITDIELL